MSFSRKPQLMTQFSNQININLNCTNILVYILNKQSKSDAERNEEKIFKLIIYNFIKTHYTLNFTRKHICMYIQAKFQINITKFCFIIWYLFDQIIYDIHKFKAYSSY